MSRNRVLFQSSAAYAGPSPASGFHFSLGNSGTNLVQQLYRVQSFSCDLNVTRTDINEIDALAAIDRVITEPPEVTANISYFIANLLNEDTLGFVTDGTCSCISGFLSKAEDERNLFFLGVPEGQDAAGYLGSYAKRSAIGIGNAFVSNYSVSAQVGGLPTASVDFAALNLRVYSTASGSAIPAVDPQNGQDITGKVFVLPAATTGVAGMLSTLLPGDITLDLGNSTIGIDLSDAKIQDFSLSVPLSRENLNKLGSKFAFSKELQFPLSTTLTVNGNVGDLGTGSLSQIFCNDPNYDLTINMRRPTCSGTPGDIQVRYILKAAKLDSQNFSQTVNGQETFSATWSTQIGAPQAVDRGVFFSGSLV